MSEKPPSDKNGVGVDLEGKVVKKEGRMRRGKGEAFTESSQGFDRRRNVPFLRSAVPQ